MSKSLLIIGASGFFGRSILDSFFYNNKEKKIKKIYLLSRSIYKTKIIEKKNKIIKIVKICADISKLNKIPFADYVIYCAINHNYNQDHKAVCNYFKLAKKYHSKSKILYTSSGAVYGEQIKKIKKIKENYLLNNQRIDFRNKNKNAYSLAKLKNEEVFKNLTKFKIKVSIARCFAFVGRYLPRDSNFVVGNLIKNILDKKNLRINANYNVIRSYMHESDLSSWLLKIVKNSNIKCPIYNVGSDDAVNISNLAYRLSKKFKLKSTLKKKISSFHDKYIPSIQKAKTELKLRLKYDSLSSINRVIYSIKKNAYF